MAVKVVDASAIAALLFDEAGSDEIARRLTGERLVAPALLSFELANVCLKKCKQHPSERDGFTQAFAMRTKLTVEEFAVNPDEVVRLALAVGLSAYDGAYLWLASQLGAELITLDHRLAKAAGISP